MTTASCILLCSLVFAYAGAASLKNDKTSPATTIKELVGAPKFDPRIINGKPARVGQFPWQVALNLQITPTAAAFCGGSLIDQRFVLTAAHCATGVTKFTIYLGSINVELENEVGRVTVESTEAVVHNLYNPSTLVNDIALIRLPQPVTLNDRISVIRLATPENYLGSSIAVTVSGWGKIRDNSQTISSTLNYADLITIQNSVCAAIYGPSITTGTVCCKGVPNQSTCNGDSGGPLVQVNENGDYTHVGVVSFVHIDGCESGNPSGYIRTSSYNAWIVDEMDNFIPGTDQPTDAPPQSTTPSAAGLIQFSKLLYVLIAFVFKRAF